MIDKTKKMVLVLAIGGCLAVTSGANWGDGYGLFGCQCQQCCCPCPPPPVEMVVCLQDPCNCCTYEARVCVPACCAGQAPRVTWRSGLFGRQVASLCWDGCGHQARVVITKHGDVRVRG